MKDRKNQDQSSQQRAVLREAVAPVSEGIQPTQPEMPSEIKQAPAAETPSTEISVVVVTSPVVEAAAPVADEVELTFEQKGHNFATQLREAGNHHAAGFLTALLDYAEKTSLPRGLSLADGARADLGLYNSLANFLVNSSRAQFTAPMNIALSLARAHLAISGEHSAFDQRNFMRFSNQDRNFVGLTQLLRMLIVTEVNGRKGLLTVISPQVVSAHLGDNAMNNLQSLFG